MKIMYLKKLEIGGSVVSKKLSDLLKGWMIMVYFTDKQRLNIAKQQYVDTEIDGHVWSCQLQQFSYHSEESS